LVAEKQSLVRNFSVRDVHRLCGTAP